MRRIAAATFLMLAKIAYAAASPVPLAWDGIWTTFGDVASEQKICAVQADAGGGNFALFARSDEPSTLRLTLKKPAWQIARVTVPIVISFAGGESFNIIGIGDGAFIRADVPDDQVKGLIHHFTADQAATVTLPNGQETPWTLDLRGTTPTIEAMAECLGVAHLWLPPPFRQAPADRGSPAGSFVEAPAAGSPAVATPAAAVPVVPQSVAPTPSMSIAAATEPLANATPLPATPPLPTQALTAQMAGEEAAFVQVIDQFAADYGDAANDMVKGGLRARRAKAICSVLSSPAVREWSGTIYELSSSNAGSGVLEVEISKNIYLKTWNNGFSDAGDKTMIPAGSVLFETVASLSQGQAVTFSGTFFQGDTDCVHETSFSQEGTMTEPEFLFRFSAVRAASP